VLPVLFTKLSAGAFTGVLTLLVQWLALGQLKSPPPVRVAVFTKVWPEFAAVGVTGMVKLVKPPAPKPRGTVQDRD
jgi:hypothetical protein